MEKEKVYQALLTALEARGADLMAAWKELQESNQQEGKSSAGDKHETSVAMLHLEMEKLGKQLQEYQRQRDEVERMSPKNVPQTGTVRLGSLIETTHGKFYIIGSFGKLEVDGEAYFIISSASPMGQLFLGKREGEEVNWNEKNIRICGVF